MKMLDEKLLEQAPDDIQEILRKSKAQTEEEAKNINCFLFQVLFSDRLGRHSDTLGSHSDTLGSYSDILGSYSDILGSYSDILGIYFDILGSDFNRLGKFSVFGSSPGGGGKCSDIQLRYGPGC